MSFKRAAYEIQTKIEVIEWIRAHANGVPTRAAVVFQLPPATVRAWWKSRNEILNADNQDLSRKRARGGGMKNRNALESSIPVKKYKEEVKGLLEKNYSCEGESNETVQLSEAEQSSHKITAQYNYPDKRNECLDKDNPLSQRKCTLDINEKKKETFHHTSNCREVNNDSLKYSATVEESCDNAEVYGKVWLADFRKLNETQKIYAKRAIDEILYHGKFNNLCHQSSVIRTKENLDVM